MSPKKSAVEELREEALEKSQPTGEPQDEVTQVVEALRKSAGKKGGSPGWPESDSEGDEGGEGGNAPKKAPPKKTPPPTEDEEDDEGEGGDEGEGYDEEGEDEEDMERSWASAEDLYKSLLDDAAPEVAEVIEASAALEALTTTVGQKYEQLSRSFSRSHDDLRRQVEGLRQDVQAVAAGILLLVKGPLPRQAQPAAGLVQPAQPQMTYLQRSSLEMPGAAPAMDKDAMLKAITPLVTSGELDSSILSRLDSQGPDFVYQMLTPEQRSKAGLPPA